MQDKCNYKFIIIKEDDFFTLQLISQEKEGKGNYNNI